MQNNIMAGRCFTKCDGNYKILKQIEKLKRNCDGITKMWWEGRGGTQHNKAANVQGRKKADTHN
jgi:hypothetical protein